MNNLSKRTVFGAAYGAVMITSIMLLPTLFPVLCIVVICKALSEFYTMSIGPLPEWKAERIGAMITATILYTLTLFTLKGNLEPHCLVFALLPFVALMLFPIFKKDHSVLENMAYIFAGICYICIPVCTWNLLMYRGGESEGSLLMSVFILIWVSDIGAYTLGSTIGQKPTSRKLAPAISPKKSWWGFFGSVVFGIGIAAVLCALNFLKIPMLHSLVTGLIVSVSAVGGDLVESLWKRRFGVKDSGNAIPGHGGIYDRFDSSFVAIPLVAVYLIAFGLI